MPKLAELKSPFPWMGGKSKVADIVWDRFGNVDNYVEPFAGSIAVLLKRPPEHFRDGYRVETVNDLNHYLANFWRSVQFAPDEVARWADWPVFEADMHARHRWLTVGKAADEFRTRMANDPEYYDAKVAGWWVWGQCCWIGGGWCANGFEKRNSMPQLDVVHGVKGSRGDVSGSLQLPELSSGLGRGDTASQQIPELSKHGGRGKTSPAVLESQGRPQLTDAYDLGRGVNATPSMDKRPHLSGTEYCRRLGQGVHAEGGLSEQIPALSVRNGVYTIPNHLLSQSGLCDARREWLTNWMRSLSDRLRNVRTCYQHWSRVCDSDSTLERLGTTGVFLDPPYPTERADNGKKSRDGKLYATDAAGGLNELRDEVRDWCIKWGSNPSIKIAVCGYEGDGYEILTDCHGWETVSWEANGGYRNQRRKGKGKSENAKRERIWFSPAAKPAQPSLFD